MCARPVAPRRSAAKRLPEQPAPPQYSEWLDFIFGRYGRDNDDEWAMDWTFVAPDANVADLFRHGMENCGRDFAQFSDAQLAVGLNALLFCNYSNIPHDVMGSGCDEAAAVSAIRSLAILYSDGLMVRSPEVLGHLSEKSDNPLWYVTYMWWDVSPIDQLALKSDARIDALFEVFEAGLASPNIGCVESALHGLGHAGSKIRPRANVMIKSWINRNAHARPELVTYAKRALQGMIQ